MKDSAFPSQEWIDSVSPTQRNPVFHGGMTLRDYFAAKAMQGICAQGGVWGDHHAAEIAQSAYRVADAMLAERNKGREEE